MDKNHPISHILTGKDNETHDLVKWLALLFSFAAIIYEGYNVYTSQHFDVWNFLGAAGAFLTAVGAGLKIKESTEPTPAVTDTTVPADNSADVK